MAIPQDALLEHINILKSVGIMPSVITIAPLAFESLLAHMKVVKDEVVATLNIGTAITVISIYKNQKLEFTRMITSKLDRLSMEVRLSLDYFLEESHGSKVEKIILFGEQAELKKTVDILQEQLSVSLVTLNPLKDTNISYAPRVLKEGDGLVSGQQIAICLGSALSHDKGINLLPEQVKRQAKDYFLSAGARFIAILGSFIFLFIYLNLQFLIEGYKERLIAAEAEVETLTPLIKEIEPIERLNKDVADRFNLVKSLLRRRNVWSGVLKDISRLLPPSIILTNLTVNETEVTLKGAVSVTKQSPENILSDFIVSLDKGIFKDISLASAQKSEEAGTLEFSLSAKLDF
ncbi:MAG: hypothetical protein Q8O13_08105 [Candidatus Omnitrophota bacterium]|nr:hypothetical protein [Candidatus Omnitrophota bacterium]